MEQYTWTLTKEQAENLVAIIDLAVKAGGLNVAEKALPLVTDLTNQINEQSKKSE
jgi:polyhydroxyalkanoate synthesis regulator phasin